MGRPLCRTLLVVLIVSSCLLSFSQTPPPQQEQKPVIEWQRGPTKGDLSGFANLEVPEGFLFTGKKGAQKLLELTHNLPSGNEVGALVPAAEGEGNDWFVIFEFDEVGFVKDEEKDKLDADAILKSIKEGTEEGNKMRAEKGWPAYHVAGWERPPFYDPKTHNLTWSTRGHGDSGGDSINHSVRLLGRRGTMNVDLVLGPQEYAQTLPAFDGILGGFQFSQGHRYADFIPGDKVADYGLTALVAGGAGAAALKLGFFGKMWKAIVAILLAAKKLIIVVFAAIGAAIKKIKDWLTGRKDTVADKPEPPSAAAAGQG